MKNLAQLVVVVVFAVVGITVLVGSACVRAGDSSVLSSISASPTPVAANAASAANAAANSAKPAGGDKTITRNFVLSKDSLSEYGEVAFDHQTHAEGMYSPDGKSTIACVECHHTDQPKSALKAPLVTSERDVVLTMASWKASSQKVNECRSCHFQDGNVPEGKTMPTLNGKDLNNEYSYHVNCNTCHDAAFKARPELKGKKGFSTSKDCLLCHAKN